MFRRDLKLQSTAEVAVISYLPINVLLQTDGAVRGGAAAQGIRGSAAALPLALSFGLELSGLHLFQRLDGHSVHRALWWRGRRTIKMNNCQKTGFVMMFFFFFLHASVIYDSSL